MITYVNSTLYKKNILNVQYRLTFFIVPFLNWNHRSFTRFKPPGLLSSQKKAFSLEFMWSHLLKCFWSVTSWSGSEYLRPGNCPGTALSWLETCWFWFRAGQSQSSCTGHALKGMYQMSPIRHQYAPWHVYHSTSVIKESRREWRKIESYYN